MSPALLRHFCQSSKILSGNCEVSPAASWNCKDNAEVYICYPMLQLVMVTNDWCITVTM